MNQPKTPASTELLAQDLSLTEAHLAKVLVLIQRILPRLEEPASATEVQIALRKAAASLESALHAHQQETDSRNRLARAGSLEAETVAIISAAIAAVLDRPHRVVSVQPSTQAVPYLNVWALEGRTQIFQSHKIR